MSFSVQILKKGLEWSSEKPFLQKRNLGSPSFWAMLFQILRFNRKGRAFLLSERTGGERIALGEWVRSRGFSEDFIQWYLIPMAAAIWSTPPHMILDYPAESLLRFFQNHGLMQVIDRPPWNTIPGGSRLYVEKIIDTLDRALCSSPVEELKRGPEGIELSSAKLSERFDLVVSGIHGIDNLKIISDLSPEEKEILSSFPYQENRAVLHRDTSLLPREKKGWESWNYLLDERAGEGSPLSVSYYINHLQPLETDIPLLVTLNPHRAIPGELVYREIRYAHPLFDSRALDAQKRIDTIQGRGGLYFTGAWQRYGFHEDGIWSAVKVVDRIRERIRS